MNSVDFGRWKLVISTSTALNRKPGVMKMSVSPIKGFRVPVARAAVSSSRMLVVPTATMRPPLALAASSRCTLASVNSPHSACITWSSVSSAFIGRNVPAPTCSVTRSMPTPLSLSVCSSASVKCSPAVGAATAPSTAA